MKLTLNDILGGAGNGAGYRGRGGESISSPDGNYSIQQQGGTLTLKALHGGADKELVASAEPKSDIHWAPDGKHIAYVSQGQS